MNRVEAAGALIFARDTKKWLIALRSPEVLDGNLWCGVGGKIEAGETPVEAARREIWEEIGYGRENDEPLALYPAYVYESDVLKFYNFIGVVPRQFEPSLNWETATTRWVDINEIPEPRHYGLVALLNDPKTKALVESFSNAGKLTLTASSQVETPFLSNLGVSIEDQAANPTVDSFPHFFNVHNYQLWRQALKAIVEKNPPLENWGLVIRDYVELCTEKNIYPFSNVHHSENDVIISELNQARRTLVKFFNLSKMFSLVSIRTTQRVVKMTSTGFVIEVEGLARLKDPSFASWLGQAPMPRFDLVRNNSRYVKTLDKRTRLFVYNDMVDAPDRWHVGYEIHINHFPDIPGNHMPSKAMLERFILEILYMPVLLSHRPAGIIHRLL